MALPVKMAGLCPFCGSGQRRVIPFRFNLCREITQDRVLIDLQMHQRAFPDHWSDRRVAAQSQCAFSNADVFRSLLRFYAIPLVLHISVNNHMRTIKVGTLRKSAKDPVRPNERHLFAKKKCAFISLVFRREDRYRSFNSEAMLHTAVLYR